MNNNGKSKASDAIISMIFLIWFVGSIIGLVVAGKTGKNSLVIALMGQYFLVFGIISIASTISNGGFKLKHTPTLIFPIIGLGAISYGLINQFGSEDLKSKSYSVLPYIFIILFVVIGVGLIIGGLYNSFYLKLVCREYVSAECVDVLKTTNSDGGEVWCPVYSYYYNGQYYKSSNDIYTNGTYPSLGQNYELYINSKNPMQFYEPHKSVGTGIGMILMGVFIICFMCFVLYMMNK